MDILIIGGGTRAKVVMDAVARAGVHRVVGFLHDNARPGEELLGSPSLGPIEDLASVAARTGVGHGILAIDDIGQRMALAQRVQNVLPGFKGVHVVDPSAIVSRGVEIGPGAVVLAGVRLETGVTIGEHAFIGSLASVGADSNLGTFTSVGAGARIGEGCHVGSGSAIGMNAGLADRVIVGTHCVVAPGAMVLESVPDLHVAEGAPARCTRTRLVGERYR